MHWFVYLENGSSRFWLKRQREFKEEFFGPNLVTVGMLILGLCG